MIVVAAIYKFTPFPDPAALKAPLAQTACANGVRGTLLLANEGINGTIAGTRLGVDAVLAHIRELPGCSHIDWKESTATAMPFGRMKVRLKREIVSLGQPDVDPTAAVGTYVEAENWNDLIADPDVALIDTRNDYEIAVGSFEGAVNPETARFRDFPAWWEANADRFEGKKIAMFCTGGIRCEKATNWLISKGVEEVFHLKGGILRYLERIPEEESRWNGQCFVFDQRVSVGHALEPGDLGLCHACRRPIPDDERSLSSFEEGVSCASCIDTFSDDDRARFRERQRQVELARARGGSHLGPG